MPEEAITTAIRPFERILARIKEIKKVLPVAPEASKKGDETHVRNQSCPVTDNLIANNLQRTRDLGDCCNPVEGKGGRRTTPRLSAVSGRIINGEPAVVGEFPAQLSLQRFGLHLCGASILNENWALTAAHCVDGIGSGVRLELLAGTITLNEGGTRHTVESYTIHPEYNEEDSWVNDVAVLRVSTPFPLNGETVAPIQLPAQGQDTPAGSPVTVVGWGSLSTSGPTSDTLQKVDIEVWSQDLCASLYWDGFEYPVYPTMICAAGVEEQASACNGDSGGPLLYEGAVVGLVSWSSQCATPPYPTVYTRVSSYVDWITQQVGA